jgi:hypothetical protein
VPLAGLQRAHADHLAREFLAAFIGDGNHDAVFALLAARGMMDRPVDAHGGHGLGGRFRIDGIEAQVVLAPRANVRTL